MKLKNCKKPYICFAGMFVILLLAFTVYGQENGKESNNEDSETSPNILRIANILDLSSEFERLSKLEKQGRWEELINLFDELIKSTQGKVVKDDDNIYREAGESLRNKMLKLGPRAKEIYRIKHDRAAERAFIKASKTMDRKALLGIVREYPLSTFADNALNLLALIDAELGNYEAAAKYLGKLLASYPDSELDREKVLIKAAWYSYYAGLTKEAHAYLENLTSDDGKRVEGAAKFSLSYLVDLIRNKKNQKNGNADYAEYHEGIPGGDYTRGGVPRDIDLGSAILWQGSLTNIAKASSNERRGIPFQFSKRQRAVSPGANDYRYQSVAFKDRIYSQTEVGINVYDKKSGRLIMELNSPGKGELFPGMNTYLVPTVTEEKVYANFIYEVSNSEDYNGILVKAAMPRFTLCAFERKTGKLKWAIHKDKKFARHFEGKWYSIPNPPIISGELLVVEVKTRGQLAGSHLAAFNKNTGELIWVTPLCSNGTELTMFGYDARGPLATMQACSGGIEQVVYCCTNLGAVFALDARTGAIRWARQYDEIPLRAAKNYYAQMRNITWENCSPVYSEGVLLVTPLDSYYVYAFNAETGEILWRLKSEELEETQFRYIAGVAKGIAVIAGTRVAAIELKTGKVLWISRHLGMTGGGPRGIVTESQVLIPFKNSVFVFALDSGKLLSADELSNTGFRREDGNLQEINGKLLVTGRAKVTLYRGMKEKRKK